MRARRHAAPTLPRVRSPRSRYKFTTYHIRCGGCGSERVFSRDVHKEGPGACVVCGRKTWDVVEAK